MQDMKKKTAISVRMDDKTAAALAYLRGLPGSFNLAAAVKSVIQQEARKRGWEKMKTWMVSDDGEESHFSTEEEALAYADKLLDEYRSTAAHNGEWEEEVESIRVYKVTHRAQVVDRGTTEMGDWVEYGIRQAP